jgi:hypothetical protein
VKHEKTGDPHREKKDSHEEKRSQTHDWPPSPNLTADPRRESPVGEAGRQERRPRGRKGQARILRFVFASSLGQDA